MSFRWPDGWPRVPDEDWTRARVDELAAGYDAVRDHGWYANLDPTVETLRGVLREGDVLVDYSGGTGILARRLLDAAPEGGFGIVDVDSSPKFLAMALAKLRDEPRVAFRLIRHLKEERRLQTLDEVLGGPMVRRGVDAIASTNAVHLYHDLRDTLRSWARVLRAGGRVHVQSGNVLPDAPHGGWIIDQTVEALHGAAQRLVAQRAEYARFRPALEDKERMARHDALRHRFFLPPRPLAHYLGALRDAGLRVLDVRTLPVKARADEWLGFLAVYHEGVLGWAGGSPRAGDPEPSEEDVALRKRLMGDALREALEGRETFDAVWTYVDAEKP